MLSTSSLQAFSAATTTGTVDRAGAAASVRLARAQPQQSARQPGAASPIVPETRPGVPPPRGSLLNLSV